MPKSVHNRSPGWITVPPSIIPCAPCRWIATEGWNHGSRPKPISRSRYHHCTCSAVVTPGVMTLREKASPITAWAMRTTLG